MNYSILVVVLLFALTSYSLPTEAKGNKVHNRLKKCAVVLEEILGTPDQGVPQEWLNRAECVGVIPSTKKFAIGIGGSYGRGVFVCRQRGGKGPWGAPAMYSLGGPNIGFQLGGRSADFVILVMNPKGMKSLVKSKFKFGVDASAAIGPKGRTAEAATDAAMNTEMLTYSRTRGLFAGVSLEGAVLKQDNKANKTLYGRKITAQDILLKNRVKTPAAGRALVQLLRKRSPRNISDAGPPVRRKPAASRSSKAQGRVAAGTVVVLRPGVGTLNVRTRPSLEGKVIGSITPGQEFTVLKTQNGWCRIQFTPGTKGWASGRYLQPQ